MGMSIHCCLLICIIIRVYPRERLDLLSKGNPQRKYIKVETRQCILESQSGILLYVV